MADEFDDLPDDLADLQNVDWDNLLGAPDSHPDPPPIPGPSSPRPASSRSSHYQFDDEIDDSFLHELDQLEHRLTQNPVQPSGFQPVVFGIPSTTLPARPPQSVPQTSRFFNGAVGPPTNLVNRPTTLPSNNHSSRSPLKRPRSPSEDECPYSFAKKGKRKASEDETHFLAAFEDEIICPICFDLFIGAQVGNPCGHSFCGECGCLWLKKNHRNGCPICRSAFARSRPMIPNIALDNLVEKYIHALRLSGDKDWGPDGSKYKEWLSRKQRWKKDVADRANASRPPQKAIAQVINMADLDLMQGPLPDGGEDDEYEDEDDDDDEDIGLIPPRVPRESRTRAQRGHYR